MKISVVTVTYNSRQYLPQAMESVLSQTFADLEYVIVDGGSTDGTLEVIRQYAEADSRITWISEPDDGIADAFNKGIARATGDIIGILNSDDTYAEGALAAVAQAFETNPETDVFYGDMLRLEGDTPLFLLKPGPVGNNIWHDMPLNHPATFVTARAYDAVGGFDPHLKVAMDYDLVLRLYIAGCRFLYLNRVLANMRYGGASDDRYVAARRDVVSAAVRQGYSPVKAWSWFIFKVVMGSIKNLLRKLRLHALIRLHPKFNSCTAEDLGSPSGRAR